MNITYYFIGLLTGVFITSFFFGKKLYKYYTRYTVQQKKLNKILNLHDNIKKDKNLDSIKTQNLNSGV